MERINFILGLIIFTGICNIAYAHKIDMVFCDHSCDQAKYFSKIDTMTIDSISKVKLKLIRLAKEVVLKHGPDYYREYKEPIVMEKMVTDNTRDLFVNIKKNNMGRVYYTVEFPCDRSVEWFYYNYAVKVYFWEDFTIFNILFGDGRGIFAYDKMSKSKKKNLVIPYKKQRPIKQVADTIKDEQGNVIEIRYSVREE